MYSYLKRNFNLDDSRINEIISNCADHKELFDDYESSCLQYEKHETDIEILNQYIVLIKELEDELNRVLSIHNQK